MIKAKKNNKNIFKKLISLVIILFGVIIISSCTKSFCTNQDNCNRLYATYGNVFSTDINETDSSVIVSNDSDRGLEQQKNNRRALHNYLTQGTKLGNIAGYYYPTPEKAFYEYMNKKAESFVDNNYLLWTNGTLDTLTVEEAKKMCKHVAIYGGIEQNEVAPIFTNMNLWYDEAIKDLGYQVVPVVGYMEYLKNGLTATLSSSTACISPVNRYYEMDNKIIYVQGKTWGQAFKEYGFFEGLFVYPFSYLVYAISNSMQNTGWAQILAIFVVTVLVRSLTIVSTILQSKSQERSQLIQPEIQALRKKYPNADTDKQQKQALAFEQMQLMRKAKTHPFRPFLFMILQFPLFICVWSALQGSASLASGRWLGIALTTPIQDCFSSFSSTQGALTGIIIFFVTSAISIASNLLTLSFNKWKQNKGILAAAMPTTNGVDPNNTTKIMSIVFIAFYIIMSYRLPAGMNIYFYLGSVITIIQTIVMEAVAARKRHIKKNGTGDGSDLASLRRSSKHRYDDQKKKSESSKPLWR